MADHRTDGVVGARIGNRARADALTVPAALRVWTIVVRTASRIFNWNCFDPTQ